MMRFCTAWLTFVMVMSLIHIDALLNNDDVSILVNRHLASLSNHQLNRDSPGNLTCGYIWRSYGDKTNCCVVDVHRPQTDTAGDIATAAIKCLPSFIIAGTQKSGTTALSAMLAAHPDISFAPKKETHFFDKVGRNLSVLHQYLTYFSPWNTTLQISDHLNSNRTGPVGITGEPPVYGESTPFYLASRIACHQIAQTLPNVKIIVLLRDPVARAFSEYKMKKRRVDQQDRFNMVLKTYAERVYSCLTGNSTYNWGEIKDCLPSEVVSADWWPKLRKVFAAAERPHSEGSTTADDHIIDKSYFRWQQTIDACFFGENSTSAASVVAASDQRGFLAQRFRQQLMSRQCVTDNSTTKTIIESCKNQYQQIQSHSYQEHSKYQQYTPKSDRVFGETTIENTTTYQFRPNKSNHETRLPPRRAKRRNIGFHPKLCFTGLESLLTTQKAFYDEINAFRDCLNTLEHSGLDPQNSFVDLNLAIDQCIKVKPGIGSQYFYRSLYLPQLIHCFQYIPRRQFLILASEELRDEPATTVPRILQFLEVGNVPSSNLTTADDNVVKSLVDKHFPYFERNTGWKLSSEDSDPMPAELEEFLRSFFRPYNHRLSHFLGKDFGRLWKT